MALQATHIKFAIDLKYKYKPKDFKKYISGSIYPDSRYTSGIGRKLTHPESLLNMAININNDFQKGWHSHLVCDLVQGEMMDKFLPPEFNQVINIMQQGNELWLKRTAIKLIQEIQIFNSFNIQKYLPMLDYVDNPNHEDIKLVRQSNKIIQKTYSGKNKITIANTFDVWEGLVLLNEGLIDRIKQAATILSKDKKICQAVSKMYPSMLELAKRYYDK